MKIKTKTVTIVARGPIPEIPCDSITTKTCNGNHCTRTSTWTTTTITRLPGAAKISKRQTSDSGCTEEDILSNCAGPKECYHEDPNSCTSFIQCIFNGASHYSVVLSCPSGQFWNDSEKSCDSTSFCPQSMQVDNANSMSSGDSSSSKKRQLRNSSSNEFTMTKTQTTTSYN